MDLAQPLQHTSRTFAITIPLLPEPTRTDVTIAYLVFRIADTLEDCERLAATDRVTALREFEGLLESGDPAAARKFAATWATPDRTGSAWHDQLLAATPEVLGALAECEPWVQKSIQQHAQRTTHGMADFLARGSERPDSIAILRRYCYVVAGIVGEMLTDIFVKRIDGFHTSDELRKSANVLGEGLQLVNILNDSAEDARRGRSFLPSGVERADVFALARQDLRDAEYFVDQLRASAAPAGYLAFSRLPLELALATLDVVERDGPGSKISREEVARILHRVISPQSEAANSS